MVLALIESYPNRRDKHRNRLEFSGRRRCVADAVNFGAALPLPLPSSSEAGSPPASTPVAHYRYRADSL
jgi:hypothetical protein